VSTFGATIVLLLGVVKRVALLKVFSGPLPRPSGQRTLVAVLRTRRNSSSGKP
jgi:hypothetical protein